MAAGVSASATGRSSSSAMGTRTAPGRTPARSPATPLAAAMTPHASARAYRNERCPNRPGLQAGGTAMTTAEAVALLVRQHPLSSYARPPVVSIPSVIVYGRDGTSGELQDAIMV